MNGVSLLGILGTKTSIGFLGVTQGCGRRWVRAAAEECREARARGGARTGAFAQLLLQASCSACSLVVAAVAEMTFDKTGNIWSDLDSCGCSVSHSDSL